MHYQILARKWRPQLFKDVIGQKYIVTAISNSLILNRIHHSWLFYGMQGTGKTTLARLLAKSLNCKLKISPNPCRKCSNCLEIEQGNFIDLHEIDGASKTKVEDIKELLENIPYRPTKGRFKIYLIDEVHMLSRHSFNALLKTIEEPPKHIKFILATTNLKKIPDSILSRCLYFQLKPINFKKIFLHISNILNQENILYEKKAIMLISQHANGSLREAITLIEQIISISNNNITEKIVKCTLNISNNDIILEIFMTIINQNIKTFSLLLDKISTSNINWENILIEILKALHYISMLQINPEIKSQSFYSKKNTKQIEEISNSLNHQSIYSYYKIALQGKKELSITPNQKMSVEMTLLRMLNLNTTLLHT